MGWAEIGLGPRARASVGERGRRGRGSVVIGQDQAKKHLEATLRGFFGQGIWISVVCIAGFLAMVVANAPSAALLIAAPIAIGALACALLWSWRVTHWWVLSRSGRRMSESAAHGDDSG